MKQKNTYYNQFLKEKNKLVTSLLKEYKEKIDKAQDSYQQNISNKFFYNLHTKNREKQTELGVNQRFFIELEESLLEDKFKKIEIEFEKKISLIEGDKVSILKNIADLQSYLEVIQTIREQEKDLESKNEFNEKEELTNSPIQWKGKELEFTQLIYSLFNAGYLTNQGDEKTKLVKQVAKAFNFNLGEGWLKNLHECARERNNDYQPKVFTKLIESWENLRKEKEG